MDTSWSTADTTWKRLRWAREHAGFATAKAGADALGMKKDTYTAYEREPGRSSKWTNLDHQRAAQFAKKFKVNWEWLLLGRGSPHMIAQSNAQERVMRAMADVDEDQQERVAAAVEALLRTGTGG